MKTTKFKVSMNLEVIDVGDVPADTLALRRSIIKAIDGISTGDVVCVKDIYVEKTGATGITPTVNHKVCGCGYCNN